jgi:hypothetical protein
VLLVDVQRARDGADGHCAVNVDVVVAESFSGRIGESGFTIEGTFYFSSRLLGLSQEIVNCNWR